MFAKVATIFLAVLYSKRSAINSFIGIKKSKFAFVFYKMRVTLIVTVLR